jgi:hypothetical protein
MQSEVAQDASDEIKPLRAAAERDARLVAIFGRQPPHRRCADVRWIAEDQVVLVFA